MGKHQVFISYHHDDEKEVQKFIDDFGDDCFIVRGVFEDDIINSTDPNYIMQQIRDRYLRKSTVTIVMIGKCTWSRKFIDWEIASTLRDDTKNKRAGLMAVALPSINNSGTLPARFKDNMDNGYATFWNYPSSKSVLEDCIEKAFQAKDTVKPDNTRTLRSSNSTCS